MGEDRKNVAECRDVLELSRGEVDTIIPSHIIDDILFYLDEYVRLKNEESWDIRPIECRDGW